MSDYFKHVPAALTQDQYNECLNELRPYFKSLTVTGQKLEHLLRKQLLSILRRRHPTLHCKVCIDMTVPEHPQITLTAFSLSTDLVTSPYDEMKAKLCKRYGDRLGTFLANRLAKMIRKRGLHEDAPIDNLRIARVGYTSHELEYQRRKRNGCCGFADEVFTYRSRNWFLFGFGSTSQWRIGFNYGH